MRIWEVLAWAVGSYSSGPPAGGIPKILTFKTSRPIGRPTLYMSSPLVAVADIECPNSSKLALLQGQQMATIASSDFLLLT